MCKHLNYDSCLYGYCNNVKSVYYRKIVIDDTKDFCKDCKIKDDKKEKDKLYDNSGK